MRIPGFLLIYFASSCLNTEQHQASAFVPSSHQQHRVQAAQRQQLCAVTQPDDVRNADYRLDEDQVKPIIRLGKDESSEKVINLHGIRCVLVTLITCPVWAASMSILTLMHGINKDFDVNRDLYDKTGKMWSRTWLAMTDSYPTYS